MITVLREELLAQLGELPALIDLYTNTDGQFVEYALDWLSKCESVLMRFRSPLAGQVANQRGRIVVANDGYQDPLLFHQTMSARKALRITARVALDDAEKVISRRVSAINDELEPLRMKMAQLISIASAIQPIPLPPTEPRTTWLQQAWSGLQVNNDTKPMHTFLSVSLSSVDRLYLLDELLSNLIAN